MSTQLRLGEIVAEVTRKDIKNVHLSVHPPGGRVRISAPKRMKLDTIRVFALSKLDWISKQQAKLASQHRETPRDYSDRESHLLWGKRYLLAVSERNERPSVEVSGNRIALRIRPNTDKAKRRSLMETWYRDQVKQAVPPLLEKWEPHIGAAIAEFSVRRMKTKWGSCSPASGMIRLNTELARKPRECLEYIVVHELVHLLEPNHGPGFVAELDRLIPSWRSLRDRLNHLPVPHEDWSY